MGRDDLDPWHDESDDEDLYRTRADRICDECNVNLDIDAHEAWCTYEKGNA